jgi:hypothetical protein
MSPLKPIYTTRIATDADFLFMRETKLEGLRPYVEAVWGWNREEQLHLFQQYFESTRCELIVVDGADVGFISVFLGCSHHFRGRYLCMCAGASATSV